MDQSNQVDISGLDKFTVVEALWKNSKVASFFTIAGIPSPSFLDEKEARRVLESPNPCFDYLSGRVIKTNFSTNLLDPWYYDRDNGQGSMAKIVRTLKK